MLGRRDREKYERLGYRWVSPVVTSFSGILGLRSLGGVAVAPPLVFFLRSLFDERVARLLEKSSCMQHAGAAGASDVTAAVGGAGQIPLLPVAVAAGLGLNGRCLCAEVEDPAGDEATEDGDVGDDDGNVVLNVVDTVVNWVRPVGLEEREQPVTVRQVDFGGADASDAVVC